MLYSSTSRSQSRDNWMQEKETVAMNGRKLATSVLPGVDPGTTLPPRSLGGLISISLFWFAIYFHWTALSVFIEPPQIIGLLYRTAPVTTSLSRTAWVNENKALALAI